MPTGESEMFNTNQKCRFHVVNKCVFFTCIICAFVLSQALAKEEEAGFKGKIDECELIEELKRVQGKEEFVTGYVINANTLAKIIRETDYDIKLNKCRIEGELIISSVSTSALEGLQFPTDWSNKEREELFTKKAFMRIDNEDLTIEKYQIIDNLLALEHCNIESIRAINSVFNKNVVLAYVKVGDLDFSDSIFWGGIIIGGDSLIKNSADFNDAVLDRFAIFAGVNFEDKVSYRRAKFRGYTDFQDCTSFSNGANFEYAEFHSDAIIYLCDAKYVDFQEAIFSKSFKFSSREETEKINFVGAKFSGATYLTDLKVKNDANFRYAIFDKLVSLQGSEIGWLDLSSATFNDIVDLKRVKLGGLAFQSIEQLGLVRGLFSLQNAEIGCLHLQNIVFENDVDMSFVKIGAMSTLPNYDGINDKWMIPNILNHRPIELIIYNRSGNEIYSTNDYANDWDGIYKGSPLPEGTYYYLLKTKNNYCTGNINIVK